MSQRYIFLRMASHKELKDEGYGSHLSNIGSARLRRRSSASLPSTRSRAPSLRHFKNTPLGAQTTSSSVNGYDSPVANHGTPSSDCLPVLPVCDGAMRSAYDRKFSLDYPDDSIFHPAMAFIPSVVIDDDDDGEVVPDDPLRCRLSKEVMFFVACLVVLATSGGLILGFGPIYSTLVRENQWSELCDTQDRRDLASITCAKQEIRLQYVFSTSFLCLSAANAFFGVFLDVAGPRLTALLGLAMSALGNFALAYGDSHSGTGAYIIIGYSLIGAGGMGSYLAAFQLLQLFEVQGFVCSALSSLFNCSGYVYMLLQVDGIARPVFFRVYGVLVVCCMLLCFLLFPTNNIVRTGDSLAIPTFHIEAPRWVNPLGLMDGMRDELKRRDLWFFAVYFGWISLIFGFAGGAIPSILATLGSDDPPAVAMYTNILYPVLVNGTFIYSPIVGYVIDHFGFKVIFVACLVMVQGFITLLLVPSLHVQIGTFFVYAMAQACLYALQFAYIMMCFPPELYGTLQAFMAIVSFVFGLFNYLLNPWTQMYLGGNYTMVLLLLGAPTSMLYFFIHVIQGCEDQTITHYDKDGNPVVVSASSAHAELSDANEHTKLI